MKLTEQAWDNLSFCAGMGLFLGLFAIGLCVGMALFYVITGAPIE